MKKLYFTVCLALVSLVPSLSFAVSGVPTTIKADVDLTNTDVVAIGAATLTVSVAVYAYKNVRRVL